MKRLVFIGISFLLLFAIAPGPAQSAPGGYTRKVILNNARTNVAIASWLPGATSPSAARPPRVIYYMTAAKFVLKYADGHSATIFHAAGSTTYFPKDPQ